MTEQSRDKFMKAVFGKDNDAIDASTAAALLAATYSGGDEKVCVRDYGRAQTRVRGVILWGGKNKFICGDGGAKQS